MTNSEILQKKFRKCGNTVLKTIDYVIDGFGRRVARKVNGSFDRSWLYRDGLRPIAEVDSAGVFTHFVYVSSEIGAPDFLIRSGVLYRVVKDHLGSVRLVLNASTGAIAQSFEYDAFGKILTETGSGFQPFGFAGGLYDSDTKLVRFGARDYDPGLGRWTNKDPIGFAGGDTNVYAYVGNDPTNNIDLDGLKRWKAVEVRALLLSYASKLDSSIIPQSTMLDLHRGNAEYDFYFKSSTEFDTFETPDDQGVMDSAQFGNYIAGFAAGFTNSPLSYFFVRAAGAAYSLRANARACIDSSEPHHDMDLEFFGDDLYSVAAIDKGRTYGKLIFHEFIAMKRSKPLSRTCQVLAN